MGKRFRPRLQADSLMIVALVTIAVSLRTWQIVFAYRQGLERLRARRRERFERALFARLERSMQSDRVD